MAASIVFCAYCGAQNLAGASFCTGCGQTLQANSSSLTHRSHQTLPIPEQTLIQGRYEILQILGKGGMGAVYLSRDRLLGQRLVALKEMHQRGLESLELEVAVQQFKREAHILAQLQHPHLPHIYDYFTENGYWYLVMSFIKGENLEAYVERQPSNRLDLPEVLVIAQQLCDVLSYLHTLQPPLIFRDLKPANIMYQSQERRIYLIDFGIARHFKPGQTSDTARFFSPGYAPIEQYGQAQTTERSDIYSLGVTLYRLLSGYDPARSPLRLPSLNTLVSGLPADCYRLLDWMLAIDESQRPQNIQVVRQVLLELVRATQAINQPEIFFESSGTQPSLLRATPNIGRVAPAGQLSLVHITPEPAPVAAPSAWRRVRQVLSAIGMGTGIVLSLIGVAAAFNGDPQYTPLNNLNTAWGIFVSGLFLFWLARLRKAPLPVPRNRNIESRIGKGMALGILLLNAVQFLIAWLSGDKDTSLIGSSCAIVAALGIGIFLMARLRRPKQIALTRRARP